MTKRCVVLLTVLAFLGNAAGPALAKPKKPQPVKLIQTQVEVPEEALLDVGIRILDPGLPPDDEHALEKKGVFADVRQSEARYIPVRLMETLQSTGHWGAVRVIPSGTGSANVTVTGGILTSGGKELSLSLRAVDSRGGVWLEKKYKGLADAQAYREDELGLKDPFHNLYNEIANDLLAARDKFAVEDLAAIRSVSELRFASDIAPLAFDGYLAKTKKGQYVVSKLPAESDPMMARVAAIRERDFLFIDTLNEYYTGFLASMSEPYDNWRKFAYEEQVARDEIKRAARMRKILGALAVFGGLMAQPKDRASAAAREAAMIGGMVAFKSGMDKSKEAKIHVEALKELAVSFDSEVQPLLVDIEGQSLKLTGSAEAQYAEWRRLLRDIFVTETGLPVDPNASVEIAQEPTGPVASPSEEN